MENFFDTVAGQWDANDIHIQRTNAIANELIKTLDTNTKTNALEYGAGTGLLSFALHNHFSEIVMMDGSQEMVRVATEKVENTKFNHLKPIQFDLEKDELISNPFGYIFTQMVMHHVMNIEQVVERFYQLLESGGKLAIADLYAEDGTFHDRSFDGHFGFDPDEFVKTLEKYGFKNVEYKQCFVIKRILEDDSAKEFPIFLLTAKK
jgi:ubiquinone/menaquinone biosynthesis C-methylase UbiE